VTGTEPEIKGLHEATGSDPEFINRLRNTMMVNRLRLKLVRQLIVKRGGNIHRVDREATKKRRAANKQARKQRRINGK